MELEEKIVFTVFFIFGYFFLKTISKRNNRIIKKSFESRNPELVNTHWFFSEKKQQIIHLILAISTLILLILIWTNQIVIPLNNKGSL